jgi:YD repeat-containing protein
MRTGMMKTILLGLTLFAASAMAGTETYSYDAAGRLIAVDYGGGVVVRYTYDKNGNILSQNAGGKSDAAGNSAAKPKPRQVPVKKPQPRDSPENL